MNMTRLFLPRPVALVGATGFAAMADITRPECIAPPPIPAAVLT